MKTIVFRVLGGQNIGYGHFFRTYSLAKAFKRNAPTLKVIFIINDQLSEMVSQSGFYYYVSPSFSSDIPLLVELKPALVILDSYIANNNYLQEIKKHSNLMLIDDNNDIYDYSLANIILNGNVYAHTLQYGLSSDCLALLGAEYLLMKEEYWENEYREEAPKQGVLITTGGTDSYEISLKLASSLKDDKIPISIIIGPGYNEELVYALQTLQDQYINLIYRPSSLKQYIQSSQCVVTAAGSTVYEVLSQGTMPIVFSMADNQDRIYNYCFKQGLACIGKYPNLNCQLLKNYLKQKCFTPQDSNNALVIDGQGANRAANKILKHLSTLLEC